MRYFSTAILIAATLISTTLFSADLPTTVEVQAPDGFAAKICPSPTLKNVGYVWEGVTDSREDKAVGSQTQGDNEPLDITATPSLDKIFEKAIPEILQACGMKQIKKANGDDEVLRISVDIEKFHAGVTKKLFTGKGTAESWLKMTLKKGYSTETASFGYEMESKGIRSGKIKQLKKTLDELLFQTLAQVPNADPLKKLK